MKQLVITCKDINQKIAAVALASSVGYTFDEKTVGELFAKKNADLYDDHYIHVLLKFEELEDDYKNIIDFVTSSWYDEDALVLNFDTDLEKINEAIFNFASHTIKISADYNAHVTREGIQVGCQKISFEDFDKLAALVKNIR